MLDWLEKWWGVIAAFIGFGVSVIRSYESLQHRMTVMEDNYKYCRCQTKEFFDRLEETLDRLDTAREANSREIAVMSEVISRIENQLTKDQG